nr:hypothetical protein [Tanacetum cinerariifolium]
MRTRNSYFPNNSSATILRRRNKRCTPNIVDPELRTIVKMADNRTMEELLQAHTEGYGETIVISEINADHFEIKKNLLLLVQVNPYHGFERENPHTHINNFKRITSTLKFIDVHNDVIKLMMFSYSLEGYANITCNGIDVVVPVDSIHAISEQFANIAYWFFLGKKVAYPIVANYVKNTLGKYGLVCSMFSLFTGLFSFQFCSIDGLDAMLENGSWFIQNNPLILKKWHPDENLLKEDVCTVPVWVKLHDVPATAFNDDGLSAMLLNWVLLLCLTLIHLICACNLGVGAGEKKTVKKPSQTSRGVPVGPKMGFKPQKEYRPVTKKPNVGSSGNMKKGMEPTIEIINSNPFDVLNSVDNDVEFGTNRGTTNLVNNEVTSSGSSFMNIDNDGEFASNTPIGKKIDKIERRIYEGKLRLLDNDRNPLVPTGIVESDSEVEVVFDETANLRISTSGKDGSDKGYGTNSLLEQWIDSYPDNDDYDPYDDDMYENHYLSEHLQSICDELDLTVHGKKKK